MSSDEIYWRRACFRGEVEYALAENVWLYPGEGPCVNGYFYWMVKRTRGDLVKRISLQTWQQWSRRKSPPREEKPSSEQVELS